MALYPQINGVRYDWSSVEININGLIFIGVKELTYSQALEPGEARGTYPGVLGRTRGEYKAEGSFSLFKQEWKELVDTLGDGFMEAVFDVNASYADSGQPTVTDTLRGCRIKNVDNSHSQGTDPLVVKVDLHVMYLLENGKSPLVNLRR